MHIELNYYKHTDFYRQNQLTFTLNNQKKSY